jgi:hypothetical protein
LPLRAGLIWDTQMLKNRNDLSAVAHYGLTGGIGLVWKRFSIDLAYVHMRGARNESYEYVVPTSTSSSSSTTSTSRTTSRTVTDETRKYVPARDSLARSNRLVVSGVVRLF